MSYNRRSVWQPWQQQGGAGPEGARLPGATIHTSKSIEQGYNKGYADL